MAPYCSPRTSSLLVMLLVAVSVNRAAGFAAAPPVLSAVRTIGGQPRPLSCDFRKTARLRASRTHNLSMQVNPDASNPESEVNPLRKFGLLAVWVSFVAYGTLLSPAEEPGASLNLLTEVLKVTENSVNPIFVALFGSLGVWPAIYAALLLPLKPRDQNLSPLPFVLGSAVVGMGGVTPYLALTRYDQKGELAGDDDGLAKIVAGKTTGIVLLLSTIFLGLFGLGVFAPNDLNGGSDYPVDVIFYTYLKNYKPLFQSIKLAHVSTIDWFALWFLSATPLLEDMKRRGWYKGESLDKGLFASFMLAPVLGACTWLAIRPPLPPSSARAEAAPEQEGQEEEEAVL